MGHVLLRVFPAFIPSFSLSLSVSLLNSCWAIFLCIAWSLKRVYLKSPRKLPLALLSYAIEMRVEVRVTLSHRKKGCLDFLYCVWFKEHLKLETSILVTLPSSLRNRIHGVKEVLVSHVTAVNAAGGTDGHWRLWTKLLISMASSLHSLNDKHWLCAVGFLFFFKMTWKSSVKMLIPMQCEAMFYLKKKNTNKINQARTF